MIERLVIHRFRGIRQGVLDNLSKVNLLIGPNNSGKTAILEMLYLGGTSGRAVEFVREDIPSAESVFAATTSIRDDFLRFAPLPRVRQRHGKRGPWSANPAILTEEGGMEVNLAALRNGNGAPPWEAFRLGAPLEPWGVKQSARFSREDIETVALFSLDRQKGIPSSMIPPYFEEQRLLPEKSRWHYLWQPDWVYHWNRSEPIDRIVVWAETGFPPHPEHVLFFDFHTANAHFTQPFAQWAKDQPWDWAELIAKHLAGVFPEMKKAKIEIDDAPDGQTGEGGYIRLPGKGGRLSIDQFGDGARHAFKVLASLIALAEVVDEDRPGLFLWEDPELFMHPATLERLLQEAMALVQEKPVQLFLSTQSLDVVAILTNMLRNRQIAPDDVKAYRLALSKGKLLASWFDHRNLIAWLENGKDPRAWMQGETLLQYRLEVAS